MPEMAARHGEPCSFRAARRRGESIGLARWFVRARVAPASSNCRRGRSSCRSDFEMVSAEVRIACSRSGPEWSDRCAVGVEGG